MDDDDADYMQGSEDEVRCYNPFISTLKPHDY